MHPTTAADADEPLTRTLELIQHLLSLLILSSLSVKCFVTRWQILRTKLTHLQTTLSQISDSTHWSQNSLLTDLLPNLLSSLQQTQSLSHQCQAQPSGGKLRMQSDVDIATSAISAHLHDLDLLIKSGVLSQHSNAIVLSQPGPGSSKEDLGFFVKDLFARLQIGGFDFKKKALESLLKLLKVDEKVEILVIRGWGMQVTEKRDGDKKGG